MIYLALVVIALVAHLISTLIFRRMKKNGSKSAVTVRVLTFIGSFLVIAVTIWIILMYSIRFER